MPGYISLFDRIGVARGLPKVSRILSLKFPRNPGKIPHWIRQPHSIKIHAKIPNEKKK
jgi:hypothetical protein